MFGNSQFAHIYSSFEDQFEPDEADYIYRLSSKGAGIAVSSSERDAFVGQFRRQIRFLIFGGVAVVSLSIVIVFAILGLDAPAESETMALYATTGLELVVFGLLSMRIWRAPSRALADRRPAFAALTRDEARSHTFSRISYGQLAFLPIAAGALVLRVSGDTDVLHGWGRLWLAIAGGLIIIAAVQAVRKFLHERR